MLTLFKSSQNTSPLQLGSRSTAAPLRQHLLCEVSMHVAYINTATQRVHAAGSDPPNQFTRGQKRSVENARPKGNVFKDFRASKKRRGTELDLSHSVAPIARDIPVHALRA